MMPLTDAQLIERLNANRPPTGIIFQSSIIDVRAADGYVRLSYDVGPEYTNPSGSVQGGIVAALLDDACAFAAIVKSQTRIFVPTLEFKTTFFAAAKPGILFAEGRCLKMAKSACFMEGELSDPSGKILARMSVTAIPRPLPEPSTTRVVPAVS